MRKTAEERANIAQRRMNVKQGRLMAILETAGRELSEEELQRAQDQAWAWAKAHTDADGDLKPDAPDVMDGLEEWADG